MDIYRSESGRTLLRDWSSLQISSLLPDARCRWIDTPLGPTHLTTVGTGADVVLLPGTTFGAAASAYLLRSLATDHRVTAVDVPGQPGLATARGRPTISSAGIAPGPTRCWPRSGPSR